MENRAAYAIKEGLNMLKGLENCIIPCTALKRMLIRFTTRLGKASLTTEEL